MKEIYLYESKEPKESFEKIVVDRIPPKCHADYLDVVGIKSFTIDDEDAEKLKKLIRKCVRRDLT